MSKTQRSEKLQTNRLPQKILTIVLIAMQLFLMLLTFTFYQKNAAVFYGVFQLLSILIVLRIIYKNHKPMFRISWILFIVIFPFAGCLCYIFFSENKLPKKMVADIKRVQENSNDLFPEARLPKEIQQIPSVASQVSLLEKLSAFPLHANTTTQYLPLGEAMLDCLLIDLQKAQKFIFIESYILASGKMWDAIYSILLQKANAGVEIRILFDEAGSRKRIPEELRNPAHENIRASGFNPLLSSIYSFINCRDHRKMIIIDGNISINGGINIGDEYINLTSPFGHWKDTAVRLEGSAVWNLTVLFLRMWDLVNDEKPEYENYKPTISASESKGYVLPFGDGVDTPASPAENSYLKTIAGATKSVYITTPYLVLDDQMIVTMILAVKSGVDVRIILPNHQDGKFVRAVNRSYYEQLICEGIKVYEYTPGFIHSKTIVADDQIAIVGSINFDFRSLYWNYECGTWMYQTEAVTQMTEDFHKLLAVSQEVPLETVQNQRLISRLIQAVLKILAPLI